MALYLEIHAQGRNPERHELIGERITLGTSETAAIRFSSVKGFAAELIDLYPGEQNVRVEVPPSSEESLVFEGAPHRQVCVPFGGEVFVGPCRLTFLKVEERRRSPVVLLGAVLALLMLGLQVYRASIPEDPATHEVSAPMLFDGQSAVACGEDQPNAALGRAQNDERGAYAKLERSAFVTEDGVAAVTLFRRASACYQVAQKSEDADRMQGQLQHQTERLNQRYAGLRLRLRVTLDKERFQDALEATQDIEALLSEQSDSMYRRWLKELEHSLERRVAQNASSL